MALKEEKASVETVKLGSVNVNIHRSANGYVNRIVIAGKNVSAEICNPLPENIVIFSDEIKRVITDAVFKKEKE